MLWPFGDRPRRAAARVCPRRRDLGGAARGSHRPVYRAAVSEWWINYLDDLQGFAAVKRTSIRAKPAAENAPALPRARPADGIETASALFTGFRVESREESRCAIAGARRADCLHSGKESRWNCCARSARPANQTERLTGTLLYDAGGGVVFKTSRAFEALRCSLGRKPLVSSRSPACPRAPTLSVEVAQSAR